MKHKNTLLLLGVIVAILAMAVAYAAIEDVSFNVVGNAIATPNQSNFKVAFSASEAYYWSGDIYISIYSVSDRAVSFAVGGFKSVGDKVTVPIPIVNSSVDLKANLSCSTTNSNETYFKVTQELESTTLAQQGGTTNLNVTIELIKNPVTENQEGVFVVTLIASPEEA